MILSAGRVWTESWNSELRATLAKGVATVRSDTGLSAERRCRYGRLSWWKCIRENAEIIPKREVRGLHVQ